MESDGLREYIKFCIYLGNRTQMTLFYEMNQFFQNLTLIEKFVEKLKLTKIKIDEI